MEPTEKQIQHYLKGHKASGIKPGDTVKVVRAATKYEKGWDNSWVGSMNVLIGKTAKVVKDCSETGFSIKIPRQSSTRDFPYFVLEKVTRKSKPKKRPAKKTAKKSPAKRKRFTIEHSDPKVNKRFKAFKKMFGHDNAEALGIALHSVGY